MEAIPTRRAFHIFVRLAGNPIFYQDDIYKLQSVLPSCTRPVIADNAVVVLATMTEESETELLERCKAALNHYHVVTLVELGRLSASTEDCSIRSMMDEYQRSARRAGGGLQSRRRA
jgi:hypothetical protein